MKSTRQTRILPHPIEDVFDYLADFSRTPEWDPGVEDARRLDGAPIGEGTQFAVAVRLAGRTTPMRYRIVEYVRPTHLVLEGTAEQSRATDRIALSEAGPSRTRVDWELDVELRGAARLVEPFLGPLLHRLGRKALDGLVQRLMLPL